MRPLEIAGFTLRGLLGNVSEPMETSDHEQDEYDTLLSDRRRPWAASNEEKLKSFPSNSYWSSSKDNKISCLGYFQVNSKIIESNHSLLEQDLLINQTSTMGISKCNSC